MECQCERTCTSNIRPASHVPDEVWLHVFSFLEPVDLKNAACVCKDWNSLVGESETLWKSKCLRIPDVQLREEVLMEKQVTQDKRWIVSF
jgi:hypothetical protein